MSEPAAEAPTALIGRVVKPHGIRGELVVEPLSDIPGRFAPGTEILLGDESTTITASRPHKGRLLLAVEAVGDRTAAEERRGAQVRAAPVDVDELEVYLAAEIVGMEVLAEDGRVIGRVAGIVEMPPAAGYDLLEVDRGNPDPLLLPAADDLVVVDVTAGGEEVLVVIDPPEGLLD